MADYQKCPNCQHNTAMEGLNGKLRCIPCGYGLIPPERWADSAQSARNAAAMSRGAVPTSQPWGWDGWIVHGHSED